MKTSTEKLNALVHLHKAANLTGVQFSKYEVDMKEHL